MLLSSPSFSQYQLIKHIASGSFGSVYKAKSILTSKSVAVKVESVPSLRAIYEGKLLLELQHIDQVPRVLELITAKDSTMIVMELLGNSLEQVFNNHNRKLSLRLICQFAIQMITALQNVHNSGYVHRDIKPENFVLGRGKQSGKVYLIDFGLGKRFQDRLSGAHIGYRQGKGLTGTALFASANSHFGIELSRRDDLESLVYVLIYLCTGKLPWGDIAARCQEKRYEKMGILKSQMSVKEICKRCPSACATMLTYVKKLKFSQKPNYQMLIEPFTEIALQKQLSASDPLNWTMSNPTVNRRSPKRKYVFIMQKQKTEIVHLSHEFTLGNNGESEIVKMLSMESDGTVENARLPTFSPKLRNVLEEHSLCEGKKTVDPRQCSVW